MLVSSSCRDRAGGEGDTTAYGASTARASLERSSTLDVGLRPPLLPRASSVAAGPPAPRSGAPTRATKRWLAGSGPCCASSLRPLLSLSSSQHTSSEAAIMTSFILVLSFKLNTGALIPAVGLGSSLQAGVAARANQLLPLRNLAVPTWRSHQGRIARSQVGLPPHRRRASSLSADNDAS